MRTMLRNLYNEPAVPDPPPPARADWTLSALLVVTVVAEAAFRSVAWKPLQLFFTVVIALALPWRRTHPLAVAGGAFTAFGLINIAMAITEVNPDEGLYTGIFMLMLPYSLLRWGSGRHAAIGIPLMLIIPWTGYLTGTSDVGETIAGTIFFLFPAELGAAIRYRQRARERAVDQARLQERELLARELHDTVAHHVSAIAIQAQAGRTIGASDPNAAMRALDIIEEEASRTLAEMRTMVGVLRKGERADMGPQPGVADIARLADPSGPLRVDVEITGEVGNLQPAVDAALYRLAQESVTNARRHARSATNVEVKVAGTAESVRLSVHDNGVSPAPPDDAAGFGLAGMAERTRLLGGTFEAGPHDQHGWMVSAVVPRDGGGS